MNLSKWIPQRIRKLLGAADKTEQETRYDWKKVDRVCRIYRPADIASILNEKQPFFQMASGGKYAIGIRRNRAGQEIPACFLRVDKDRRRPKERKRMRRMARTLAEATA